MNHVDAGLFAGGTITFEPRALGPTRTRVTAIVSAPLGRVAALLAPFLARSLRRSLAQAFAEDRDDLESGLLRESPLLTSSRRTGWRLASRPPPPGSSGIRLLRQAIHATHHGVQVSDVFEVHGDEVGEVSAFSLTELHPVDEERVEVHPSRPAMARRRVRSRSGSG